MNIKERLDNSCGATILLVGDSLTGEATFMYPYRIAELLAAKYPTATVRWQARSFIQTDPLPPYQVIQCGPGQTINVIRDGVPGNTTFDCINRMSNLYRETPVHLVSFFLGVNDAITNKAPMDVINNLTYLGNYACQTYGAQVCLITPAWSEQTIGTLVAGYAAFSRLAARKNGFNLVDSRRIFEDHYTGTGNAGQGFWFAEPSDPTHFGREGHYAIADEFMRVHGW